MGGGNELACSTVIPGFRCPSAPIADGVDNDNIESRTPSSYIACGSGTNFDDFNFEGKQDGMFYNNSRTRMRDLTDGASNTIAIGEAQFDVTRVQNGNVYDHWAIGSPQIPRLPDETSEFIGSTAARINIVNAELAMSSIEEKEMSFGSYHVGGCQVLLGDASVRFVSENVNRETWTAIGTRSGGEVTGEF